MSEFGGVNGTKIFLGLGTKDRDIKFHRKELEIVLTHVY
jgi:hypothetical protein